MKREIRDKRNEYMLKSKALRSKYLDSKCKDTDKVMQEQKEIYKKWDFYNNIIRAEERINKNV